jgi:hypothetical protein
MSKVLRISGDIVQALIRPDLADLFNTNHDEAFLEAEADARDIAVEELLLIFDTDYDSVIVWKDGGPVVKVSWELRHAIRNSAVFIA